MNLFEHKNAWVIGGDLLSAAIFAALAVLRYRVEAKGSLQKRFLQVAYIVALLFALAYLVVVLLCR